MTTPLKTVETADREAIEPGGWRRQLSDALHSTAELAEIFPDRLDEIASLASDAKKVESAFPTLTTPYYASLIGAEEPLKNDPIFKQAFPSQGELRNPEFLELDPLGEEMDSPVPRLVHRYSDRVLLLATNRCALHCRFCLRKRCWAAETAPTVISTEELDRIAAYLAGNPNVREVLVSGGDPLLLETAKLADILSRISRVPSIDIVRIGSRVPVALPMRVDSELVDLLSGISGLWLATHFNHPVELTEESLAACARLTSNGVPILNQTVLLKGINDSPDILEALFAKLAANRVKPHYLFHLDPVVGTAEFATGIQKGLAIMRSLRNRLSSVATPTFAIDLPNGGGKVPLQPSYERDGQFERLDGEFAPYWKH